MNTGKWKTSNFNSQTVCYNENVMLYRKLWTLLWLCSFVVSASFLRLHLFISVLYRVKLIVIPLTCTIQHLYRVDATQKKSWVIIHLGFRSIRIIEKETKNVWIEFISIVNGAVGQADFWFCVFLLVLFSAIKKLQSLIDQSILIVSLLFDTRLK